MSTFFVLVFLVAFSLCILGLVRPQRFQKIFSSSKNPRKTLKQLGIVSVLSFLAIGFTAPDQKQLSNISTKNSNTKQSSQEKPKSIQQTPQITKETVTETEPVAYESKTVNDSTLAKGISKVTSTGEEGIRTITYEITYTNGKQTDKKLIKEEITVASTAHITAIGTKAPAPKSTPKLASAPQQARSNCDPNYSPCVPNVSYDLDCPDIGFSVKVTGYDKHRFDRDNDGYGCESY